MPALYNRVGIFYTSERMIQRYLSLVKFSHTIFALPFALIGMLLGISDTTPITIKLILLILGCMVSARSAAMAYNRLVDRDIDADNPRTAIREIPSGQISPNQARRFIAISVAAFLICAYFIRPICAVLAPIALLAILGYSHTKRFTSLCHYVLGLGLGLAPVGAYIAVTGDIHPGVVFIGLSVMCWVGGFDVVYALQDMAFDRAKGLHSIPANFGMTTSLWVSRISHVLCLLFLAYGGYLFIEDRSWISIITLAGYLLFVGCVAYQHRVIRPSTLDLIDRQFFAFNGTASLLIGLAVLVDYFFLG